MCSPRTRRASIGVGSVARGFLAKPHHPTPQPLASGLKRATKTERRIGALTFADVTGSRGLSVVLRATAGRQSAGVAFGVRKSYGTGPQGATARPQGSRPHKVLENRCRRGRSPTLARARPCRRARCPGVLYTVVLMRGVLPRRRFNAPRRRACRGGGVIGSPDGRRRRLPARSA